MKISDSPVLDWGNVVHKDVTPPDQSSMGSELGFSDAPNLAQTIGIVGIMVVTSIFPSHIQTRSSDMETRVLNDLEENIHKVIEVVLKHPTFIIIC